MASSKQAVPRINRQGGVTRSVQQWQTRGAMLVMHMQQACCSESWACSLMEHVLQLDRATTAPDACLSTHTQLRLNASISFTG